MMQMMMGMLGVTGEEDGDADAELAERAEIETIRQGWHVKPETRKQYRRCMAKMLFFFMKNKRMSTRIVTPAFKEKLEKKLRELRVNMSQENDYGRLHRHGDKRRSNKKGAGHVRG